MATLGISLGTTTAGIAVLDNNTFIDGRTHSFRAHWSTAKAEAIAKHFGKYIKRHGIQLVVIKLPPVSHQPHSVQHLLQQVQTICERHGCHVQTMTRKDLRRAIPEIRNNQKLMRYVVERYPIVTPEYERALRRKNNYHKKLFEAIAVAHICNEKGG